jgi:tetratricopeptide (TPR) repeat protein
MISPEEYKILKSFSERIPNSDPGAHNNLAVVYYNKGLYEEAIEQLEQALAIDPNFILARNNLDVILKKSGRLDDKVKELAHRIEAEPFDELQTLELADTYRKLSRYSQAIIFYKKIIDFNPGSYEAHYGLGVTLKSLGKYDDALEELKRSLEIKISPEGYRLLGEVYFNKGIIDLAIKNFQESLLLDPSSAETHFFLGFALGEKGKHKEGREEIRHAIEINPALAQFEPNLPIEIKEHKSHLEFLKEQLGMPKTSVNEYQAHFNLGLTYRNKGLFSEAKREFDECLKLKNNDADLYVMQGEISVFLNKLDEAFSFFTRGYEIDPLSPKCANGLGVVCLKKNDYNKALSYFEKSIGLDKSHLSALNNLAVTQTLLDRGEEALKNLKRAKDLGCEDARYNLGMYFFRKGDHDSALKLFTGESADDNFFRGLVYSESGRDEEAVASFNRTAALAPGYAGAYYNLGFLLMKIGRFEEGLSSIRKGMEIEPNYEKDKHRLAIAPELYEFGPFYVPQKTPEPTPAIEEREDFFPHLEVPKPEDYLIEAENCLKKREFERALELADEALKLSPEMEEAVILKAKVLFQLDNADDAVNVMSLYGKNHPESVRIFATLGNLLRSIGRIKQAKEQYMHLLGLQGDNQEWLADVGDISYAMGDIDEAMAVYNKLYSIDSQNVLANLGLLKIYLKKKDLDKAKIFVDYLEKVRPNTYDFNVYAGMYSLERNDHAKARAYLEKAIETEPSKPLSYYNLGLLYVQEGKFDDACAYWKKAMLLSPDEEMASKISHCLNITLEMLEFLKKEV